jgi:hypothetical protein
LSLHARKRQNNMQPTKVAQIQLVLFM